MEIYLMQHSPALPKDKDPDEGLSPEGEERIHTSGKALKKMGIARGSACTFQVDPPSPVWRIIPPSLAACPTAAQAVPSSTALISVA